MRPFLLGNLYLFLSLGFAVSSQIVLKKVIGDAHGAASPWHGLLSAFDSARIGRTGLGLVFLVAGFLFWVLALVKLPLSYAYPVAACSVPAVVFFSAWSLGETVTPQAWIGTVLIVIGVVLLTPSVR